MVLNIESHNIMKLQKERNVKIFIGWAFDYFGILFWMYIKINDGWR